MTGAAPSIDKALGVEAIAMTMRFGDFTALDNVELKVRPGSFHALLGENGAGKSTLVKCIMGYYHPTAGDVLVGGREQTIANPKDAHALGLGMVYQHFTLVPAMSVAENLVLARDDVPAVVDWAKEKKQLAAFLDRMPFRVPLDAKVSDISAGERQKCEILKQLYLKRRFLILDEPTSVLTPAEADEVLGMLRAIASGVRSATLPWPASLPRRRIVTSSAKPMTSRNLCVIISTVSSPRRTMSRSTLSTSSASPGVSTEVGSSRMRKRRLR